VVLFVWIVVARAAEPCTPAFARVVSVQGNVEIRRAGADWLAAELNATLCAGDMIRVHRRGRSALQLSNETTLRLDQGTVLTLTPPDNEKATLLDQVSGGMHVITRTPKAFRVKTPFVNANVEGTEFAIRVDQNRASVTVYEGRVVADNELGKIDLASGEEAVAAKDSAPRKDVVVSPTDGVKWTLYFPAIFDYSVPGAPTVEPAIQRSVEAYRNGDIAAAIDALQSAPPDSTTAGLLAYRAGLLLLVGRLDEARPEIERSLQLDPARAESYSLQAVIAIVENDKSTALAMADKAVAVDPASPVARIAQSYALQAAFNVEGARSSVKEAVRIDPKHALGWARLAEMELSVGHLAQAESAARTAATLSPNLARAHTMLGFAQLTRIETKGAETAFLAAIRLDQADPLPRLGLGLAKIRGGDLAAGREQIEIATALGPTDSLTRSYLGKAYFDERRSTLASTQFRLAKELDPNDPTPWFYDSLRKESDNQLVESVEDLVESIRLNDRRAVYRSRLLLDEDLAARSASLARSFLEIDLREAATADAALALAIEPGSASSHRFLSDLKAEQPRHEITRASEMLQAQLRQPLSVTPLQAQLSSDRLFSLRSEGPSAAGFNEFGSLFLSNGPSAQLQGLVGSQSTSGAQGLFRFIQDRVGVGVSALRFTTQGTRPNGDSNESAQSGLVQWAITPDTSAQVELSRQRREFGDTVSRFDPEAFTTERNKGSSDDVRFGMRHSFDPSSNVLVAFNRRDDLDEADFGLSAHVRSSRAEAQHLLRTGALSIVSGVSWLEGTLTENFLGDITESKPRHLTLYAYSTYALVPGSTYLEAGGSFDHLRMLETGDQRQFNPKLGLVWQPRADMTVRAAAFRVLKRRINADAGLEPTQIAGFDQFFDDNNGTKSWGSAVAADFRPAERLRTGLSVGGRNLEVPLQLGDEVTFDKWREREAGAYLHWTIDRSATAALRVRHTRYERPLGSSPEGFEHVETTEVPLSLKLFGPGRFWSSLVVNYVSQRGRFIDASFEPFDGSSRFTTVDLALGYRFPQRRGDVSLECANLFDKSFRFQDIGLEGSRFVADRTCRLRLSVDL